MQSFLNASLRAFRMLPPWLAGALILALLALMTSGLEKLGLAKPTQKAQEPVPPKCVVRVLKHATVGPTVDDDRPQNNYHILVDVPNTTEDAVTQVVKECRAFYCPDGKCNFAFYDNAKAFDLYEEKITIDPAFIVDWERQNRNFMSDHTLAYYHTDNNDIHYYPLVDTGYVKYGGKNLRGKTFD